MRPRAEIDQSGQQLRVTYMAMVITMGLVAVGLAAAYLPYQKLDLNFLLLAACTLGLSSRVLIKIPRFKAHIAVSDTFIFLTLILYGGEAAVLLAAAEAIVSSWRFCNKIRTVFFNSATMAIATGAVLVSLAIGDLGSEEQLHGHAGYFRDFVLALFVIALTQFIVNTAIASFYDYTKHEDVAFWETWKSKYVWTFFTYLIGAIGAGTLVYFVDRLGFGVVIATIPIILFISMAYKMYLKNIEMSIEQAEQAERYAMDLKAGSEALRESEERFRSAFNYAPIGIALFARNGRCLRVNHALTDILGYSEAELLDLDFQSLIFPEDLRSALRAIAEIVDGKYPSKQMEQRFVHKSGRTVWTSWSLSAAGNSTANGSNLIFQIQDVTGKKLAEEKLQHEATHDALTGLPNRLFFMHRLTAALEKIKTEPKYHVSVLFIDLDRFKYVNDSLGHLVGDQLLVAISHRLRDSMRPPDIVARLGGDEFVILVEGRYYNETLTSIAERIQRQFSQPFELDEHEVYSSASIGILHASEKHLTSEDIMRDADTAMYQAKRAGKARHEVFDESMRTIARETLQLETDLRRAIAGGDLEVEYQPIFELETGRLAGAEALARWNHPTLGEIPPGRFIALAEEIGLIDALSEQVLRRTVTEMAPVVADLDPTEEFRIGVNLSSSQFAKTSLVTEVTAILEETKFPPRNLKLEITESALFEHQENAVQMLRDLRELGVGIDIDDFGTGYSNLGYLARLPISTLKIDRSFVSPITSEGANHEIVRTIISMARNLGLAVIAEGIESETQMQMLIDLGCQYGQGYLLARPMTLASIRQFLLEHPSMTVPNDRFDDLSVVSTVQ